MGMEVRRKFTCDATQVDGPHATDTAYLTTSDLLPPGWTQVDDHRGGGAKGLRFCTPSEANTNLGGVGGGIITAPLAIVWEYRWTCDYAAGHGGSPPVTTTTTAAVPDGWVAVMGGDGQRKVYDSAAHAQAAI